MSPNVPLIDVLLNVTVKWKSLFVSPLFPLTSFDTMRFPVAVGSFLFVSVIYMFLLSCETVTSSPLYLYPGTPFISVIEPLTYPTMFPP